jgi:hypothetical protein
MPCYSAQPSSSPEGQQYYKGGAPTQVLLTFGVLISMSEGALYSLSASTTGINASSVIILKLLIQVRLFYGVMSYRQLCRVMARSYRSAPKDCRRPPKNFKIGRPRGYFVLLMSRRLANHLIPVSEHFRGQWGIRAKQWAGGC